MSIHAIFKKFAGLARSNEDVARNFTRLFQSTDGQIVMDHLYQQTFGRITDPVTNNDHLRFLEGQRQLVLWIAQMTAKGTK